MNPAAPRPEKKRVPLIFVILFVLALAFILAGLMLPSLAKAKAKSKHLVRTWESFDVEAPSPGTQFKTESYDRLVDNPFLAVRENPVSTFSVDVDTASYSNIRRFLEGGRLPPPDAVRIEEMLNYFNYAYPEPAGPHPFSVTLDASECPWNGTHRLVRVGLKGRTVESKERPPGNFVFLIDVSGSMAAPNKLPLLQRALELLVNQLSDRDRVALVVYAGSSGLVLDSTRCVDRATILRALRRLQAGGSTNGGQGIELAYRTALAHFIKDGINRVILCTDGDFNVGVTSEGDLARLIAEKARSGVFLTVLGFGMGNYKDATLEKLADLGNGNYGYIDTIAEARKLLIEQLNGTLMTIAKDVKIQVEFNPSQASAYRLIGYENRLLRKEDFNDDSKDAGEIGAGHTVTALYEVVPPGKAALLASADPLKYQTPAAAVGSSPELLTIKLRYKAPTGADSQLMTIPFVDAGASIREASTDFKFAGAVAAFGLVLRNSEHRGSATLDLVQELARPGNNSEPRAQFLELVQKARGLSPQHAAR